MTRRLSTAWRMLSHLQRLGTLRSIPSAVRLHTGAMLLLLGGHNILHDVTASIAANGIAEHLQMSSFSSGNIEGLQS